MCEILKNFMKNACKHVKWWKMKGKKVLPIIDEEKLWSADHENDKKKIKNDEGLREELKW